jgi:type II secretory pathway component GspD/PulD (secretin)/tetratricopeptide (TPR) repeat protein
VALGLVLSPVLGAEGVAPAQSADQASTVAVVRGADPGAGKTDDVETVRQLVREGRKALQDGDRAKAERLARQAAAMKVNMPFWENDTPEKLLIDIGVRATPPPGVKAPATQAKPDGTPPKADGSPAKPAATPAKADMTPSKAVATPPKATATPAKAPATPAKTPAKPAPADPHVLVRQGYDALKAGKLDDAQRLAQQANAMPNVRWGLFEDTPSKLMDEVQKSRSARDKAESVRVLTDARRLYEQGKYDEAEKLAYKAGNLHGPYGMWDFGDKPDKLIAEIHTAKEKSRRVKVPPVPGTPAGATTAVASKKPDAKPDAKSSAVPGMLPTAVVKQPNAPPAPSWPSEVQTADAKGSAKGGVTTAAGTMTPAALAGGVVPVATPVPAPVNPAKIQAQQCMAEGKRLMQGGRYLEARAKFLQAQRLNVDFGPSEETPERCLMDLAGVVVRHIDVMVRDASGPVTSPEHAKKCEAQLVQAKQLAAGFGLDTHAIEIKLVALKGAPAQPVVTSQPVVPAPQVVTIQPAPAAPSMIGDGMAQGQKMLDAARMELRRGQTEVARQIATEVYNGPYGAQSEAAQVLRSIDVEEHNQRVLTANRSFDAGMAAYRNKDYAQALVVFRQVDASLLPADKHQQLKEVVIACGKVEGVAQATTVPSGGSPAAAPPAPSAASGQVVQAGMPGGPTGTVTPASANAITGLQGQQPAMTAPAEGDSLAAQVQAMQQIEYQRLRAEGLDVQSKALAQFERGETDAALETLDLYLKKVKSCKLDSASIARLQRPVEAKMQSFKLLKSRQDFNSSVVRQKEKFNEQMGKEALAEQKKQQQVKELMKQFNSLYKEGKYKEAELAASKAHELDPDDPATFAAVQLAQIHGNVTTYEEIQKRKDDFVLKNLNDTDEVGPAVDAKNPVAVDPVTLKIAKAREKDKHGITLKSYTEKEKEIQAKLTKPVTVNFHNVPLRQALDDMRAMSGMNIHLESQALAAETVSAEQPVSLKVDNISLKSAMNLLLNQVHLTYVIQDEVVKVTTEKAARGKLVQKVFSVADLIIPIDDYVTPSHMNLQLAMERINEQQKINLNGSGNTPFVNNKFTLQNGQSVGTGSGTSSMSTAPGSQASMSTGAQPGNTFSPMAHNANVSPTKQTMQDMLIKLITNTVAPQSWAEVGGAGTIDYMPIGLALVVNQTPDVQEQVADLLEALRRLQDLEVAVEVRMITLAETFFERIGLDFNVNIKTDKVTSQYEPQLVTNQFKPQGQVNDFSPTRFVTGLLPTSNAQNIGQTGQFTSDLDVPIRNSSFQYAIPPFAYPNNPGFNGGLSMGLAFLSDIQVYMFMEAAQGDRRTNVMQAPKLTMFNGQTSTITITDQQFFVTNVNVVGFGGQIVFVPVNNPVPLGVSLAIQAVVSADRRFVRLNLNPQLSNLASAIVPLFPVTTFITPVFEGGAQGQPIPFTQFVQQPQVSSVNIQTTVSIPDGGTVILGGLKTLSEGRNEFGPPVLSKLPYVNRLFRNVGYGREAQSLLLMVTPRIIINSEEEERQTGVSLVPPIQP